MARSDTTASDVSMNADIDDDIDADIQDDIADEAESQTDQISAINRKMDDLVADLQRNN